MTLITSTNHPLVRPRQTSNTLLVSQSHTALQIHPLGLIHNSTPPTSIEHEHIEAEEDARERDFEGLDSSAPLDTDRPIQDPLDAHAHGSQDPVDGSSTDQIPFRRPEGSAQGKPARIERVKPSAEDLVRIRQEAKGQGAWGENDMHRPRNVAERMRKGMPYSEPCCSGTRRLLSGR
jgi:hypothetical protein